MSAVVGVTASADVPTVINIPCARGVSTTCSVLAVVGVLCCSSCLLCCVSAWCCCVLTTVVSSLEFFAMARVSFVAAIITAVEVSSATGVSKVPGVCAVVGAPDVVGVPTVVSYLLLLGPC